MGSLIERRIELVRKLAMGDAQFRAYPNTVNMPKQQEKTSPLVIFPVFRKTLEKSTMTF